MNADRPLVSVVTPVYDGDAYLAETLESVLAQDYDRWEHVVLDNASTDRTPEIAARYAERDDRIRVVRNDETLPLFDNWNASLRLVSPEARYVKFVHADDLLFPDCLSRMVAAAERHPAAALVAAFSLYGSRVKLDGLVPYPLEGMSGPEVARRFLRGGPNVFGSPTSLLLRADLVRDRDLYDGRLIQADLGACLELLRHDDYAFVHRVLTYTRVHEGSETSTTAELEKGRLGRLELLRVFGPYFLSEAERASLEARQLRSYYRFLALRVGEGKEPRFWDFHRGKMAEMGTPLRAGRLWRSWAFYAFPWKAARSLYRSGRGLRRRLRRTPTRAARGSGSARRSAA